MVSCGALATPEVPLLTEEDLWLGLQVQGPGRASQRRCPLTSPESPISSQSEATGNLGSLRIANGKTSRPKGQAWSLGCTSLEAVGAADG